jgi:general stress protein 13
MESDNCYKKGKIVKATVSGITNYGIFVKLDNNYDGLIHISEISDKYVKDPNFYASVNDRINVKILEIDEKHSQMKLSIRNINYKGKGSKKKMRIIETSHGFQTLAYQLPVWIEENLEMSKK